MIYPTLSIAIFAAYFPEVAAAALVPVSFGSEEIPAVSADLKNNVLSPVGAESSISRAVRVPNFVMPVLEIFPLSGVRTVISLYVLFVSSHAENACVPKDVLPNWSKSAVVIAVFDAGVDATRTWVVVSAFCSAVPSAAKEKVAAEIVSPSGIAEVSKRKKQRFIAYDGPSRFDRVFINAFVSVASFPSAAFRAVAHTVLLFPALPSTLVVSGSASGK